MSLKCSVSFLFSMTQQTMAMNQIKCDMPCSKSQRRTQFTSLEIWKTLQSKIWQYLVFYANCFVVMTMGSTVWFVFFKSVSVLPCVCSINRTFTPYKAYVPDQSTVFVCIVFVPIKKCSLCSFFCRNSILSTTIIWHRSRIYNDTLTFSHFSCPVQISGQFVSCDSFSSSWNSHKRHH